MLEEDQVVNCSLELRWRVKQDPAQHPDDHPTPPTAPRDQRREQQPADDAQLPPANGTAGRRAARRGQLQGSQEALGKGLGGVELPDQALESLSPLAAKESDMKEMALRVALALVKAGDNAGMPLVLKALEDSDTDRIKIVVNGLGGETNMYQNYRRDFFGVTVGAGALTKAEVAKLVTTIKSRLKFWSDGTLKSLAVEAILDLEAKVKAAGL